MQTIELTFGTDNQIITLADADRVVERDAG